jgi:hypothetical protein
LEDAAEMQLTVAADNDFTAKLTKGGGAYTIEFPRIKINEDIMDEFREGEKRFEFFTNNKRASLHFLIELEE